MDVFSAIISWVGGKLINVLPGLFDDFPKDVFKWAGGAIFDRIYLWLKKEFKPQLQFLGVSPRASWTLYFGNILLADLYSRQVAFDNPESEQYIYGDIEATLLASETFCSWFESPPIFSRFFSGADNLKNVVISVGGPKWNKITQCIIGEIGSPVLYTESFKGTIVKIKGVDAKIPYCQKTVSKVRHIEDVGIILIGKAKAFAEGKMSNVNAACIIMGYSTYGVRLAAEYLRRVGKNKGVLKKCKKHSKLCLMIKGVVEIDSNGEVISYHFSKNEPDIIFEEDFLSSVPYNY